MLTSMGHAGCPPFTTVEIAIGLPIPSCPKHGERLAMSQWPPEKHVHAALPASPLGRTSPLQGPHASLFSPTTSHVVLPSLQSPWFLFLRRPVQQAAVVPCGAQEQPGRFLSSGHSGVPPGEGGGTP